MPSLLIVEHDPQWLQRIMAAAQSCGTVEIAAASGEHEARGVLGSRAVDVLVLGPSLSPEDALSLASHAETGLPATVVILPAIDTARIRAAMRAGAADVVAIDEPVTDIAAAIGRGCSAAARQRGVEEAEGASAVPLDVGKVMTVFSTKGGVGKTVLATNLATALAKETGKRVAIVDLDLEFGDVAIMLGLKPEHTILEAVKGFDRLDSEMLHSLMVEHSSGLKALLAPVRPEDAESVSAGRVGQILDMLRRDFDYLVIDTCPAFSEAVLAALDRSDRVYLITMMDVASIKNTRICVQKLRQLGYDNGRMELVLNRSDSKVLLQVREVEQAIDGEIVASIPSNRIVPRSVNKGVPVVLEDPKSNVGRSILTLAREAAERSVKEAEDVA